MENWWEEKIRKSEYVWHPDFDRVYHYTEFDNSNANKEAYNEGWNDAIDEMDSELSMMKKYS